MPPPPMLRRLVPTVRLALALASGLAAAAAGAVAQQPAAAPKPASSARPAASLPARLADSTFWRLVTELSEPNGYFRSDNLVSNEVTFQYVIPTLQQTLGTGRGAYLGVGPDQNFTYIVALRPQIAFIVDIRRGAMLQHLYYKALVELSKDRADFLSKLFSRPRPAKLAPTASVDALLAAFERVAPDSALLRATLAAVRERLVTLHGFVLDEDDLRGIEYVHTAFYDAGPDLTYSYPGSMGMGGRYGRRMPTYGELIVQTDSMGTARGYLASEENFRILRELQRNNLVIPVVGDFAGPKALRAVGGYLRDHGTTVRAFYLSNVEQYLFRQDDDWRRFFANAATLPVDSTSVFIRAVFNGMGYMYPNRNPTMRSVTVYSPIIETIRAVADGRIVSYYDVIQLSR
ncbi:MAG TPA: hypothetical protein VFS08_07860 [Gemmatimonadaceae bacterium]|nr:hypothetical protein [Gemmatimonadaceae bacterium]